MSLLEPLGVFTAAPAFSSNSATCNTMEGKRDGGRREGGGREEGGNECKGYTEVVTGVHNGDKKRGVSTSEWQSVHTLPGVSICYTSSVCAYTQCTKHTQMVSFTTTTTGAEGPLFVEINIGS